MASKYKACLIAFVASRSASIKAPKSGRAARLKSIYPEEHDGHRPGLLGVPRYSENTGFRLRPVPAACPARATCSSASASSRSAWCGATCARPRRKPVARLGAELGLLAGGALGNIADRVAFGKVTDFVVWKAGRPRVAHLQRRRRGAGGRRHRPSHRLAPPEHSRAGGQHQEARVKPVLLAFDLPLLGRLDFPAYFTLLTIGFGLAMLLTVRESKRLGQDSERILDTNLWMIVWGIIGARALHLIADGHFQDYVNLCVNSKLVPAIDARVTYCTTAAQCGYEYLCDAATNKCYPPKDCFAAVEVWRGGLAYYGGFIFAVGFAYDFVRKHKLGWWKTADLASPGIMLGLFFGRLGCFLNGCCYGKQTSSWVGVTFPRGGSAWRAQLDAHLIENASAALPVHPTQLYESVACFDIFLILYFVVRPRRRHLRRRVRRHAHPVRGGAIGLRDLPRRRPGRVLRLPLHVADHLHSAPGRRRRTLGFFASSQNRC